MERLGESGCPVLVRSEEHTSELQSQSNLVCRLLLEKKKPAIDGFLDKTRPISSAEKAMVAAAARRLDEAAAKQQLGVEHWVRDVSWPDALERLVSRP